MKEGSKERNEEGKLRKERRQGKKNKGSLGRQGMKESRKEGCQVRKEARKERQVKMEGKRKPKK